MKKDIVYECFKAVKDKKDVFKYDDKIYIITEKMASQAYNYMYVSAMVSGICTGVSRALLKIDDFVIGIIISVIFGIIGFYITRYIFRYFFTKEI